MLVCTSQHEEYDRARKQFKNTAINRFHERIPTIN